jgi:hypothetical protein
MKNPLEGKQAIRNLDGQLFKGLNITVKESNEKKENKKCIYALVSFEKNECYVGQTCNFKKRFMAHLSGYGCETSAAWISTLNEKPIPIILEEIEKGYDSDYQADILETVWRLVANRRCWEVVNFPYLIEFSTELEAAVEARIDKWSDLLKKLN